MWWDETVAIEIIDKGVDYIFVKCTDDKIPAVRYATFIHAKTTEEDSKSLWNLTGSREALLNAPWIILVYLNIYGDALDKIGGRGADEKKIEEFHTLLSSCNLLDLKTPENSFTWNNKRCGEHNIKEKIDWVLSNPEKMELYPKASVLYDPACGSDHSSIILKLDRIEKKMRNIFRFEPSWLENEEYLRLRKDGMQMFKEGLCLEWRKN